MDSVPTISDESVNKSPKAKSKKTITKVMNNDKSLQSVAETYLQMQAAPASVVKPSWVPSTIAEEHVNEFVKAVIEARVNGKTVVEFNEKKKKSAACNSKMMKGNVDWRKKSDKDITKKIKYPLSAKDAQGRLRVGAAIGATG